MDGSSNEFDSHLRSDDLSGGVDITIREQDLKGNCANFRTKFLKVISLVKLTDIIADQNQFGQAVKSAIEKNSELETKIRKKTKELAESEKMHEKQQFHIETLNMMTKYQVVFLKLEASLKKIVANNEWRDELRKRRGFMRFAENALKAHAVSRKTKDLITAKTERV